MLCGNDCKKCKKNIRQLIANTRKIVLIGAPNVGKSVIFEYLSGKYVNVSNYPGTTVDITHSKTDLGYIIDTPGIYTLVADSEDERVTIDYIANSDIILHVVSAVTIDRDILLLKSLTKYQKPIILVVNQIDQLQKLGGNIDFIKLEQKLSLPIIPTIAIHKKGLEEIKNKISDYKSEKPNIRNIENIDIILKSTLTFYDKNTLNYSEIIDKILLHKVFGWVVLFVILYIIFKLLAILVAGDVVDLISNYFDDSIVPFIKLNLSPFLKNHLISDILIGEFGIFTMALKIVFSILIPLLSAFYFCISVLEDSGYIPRLVVISNNLFKKIGLNGKAVIPMILGFGCSAMGMISTRILNSLKERKIAIALIGICIPCAAQQAVVTMLLASTSDFSIYLIYLFVMILIFVFSGLFLKKIIPGETSDLIIDLPYLKIPMLSNLIKKTFYRMKHFLCEVIFLFFLCSAVISILNYYQIIDYIREIFEPISVSILNLPTQFADVFVSGVIKRDFSSVILFDILNKFSLTKWQLLTSCLVISLSVPCITSIMVIVKEIKFKNAILLWGVSFISSILVGGIIAKINIL